MITQENWSVEELRKLSKANRELRMLLHNIGVEAAQALDWENEETWKNALQRIAALARDVEEGTK